MNGTALLPNEWTNINSLQVKDINGMVGTLSLVSGQQIRVSVKGNSSYGQVGFYFWEGTEPQNNNIEGADIVFENQKGIITKGADNIWVKPYTNDIDISLVFGGA